MKTMGLANLFLLHKCETEIMLYSRNVNSKERLSLQTTLCNTALDNPTQRNKDQMINAALKFLETDTVWYKTYLLT